MSVIQAIGFLFGQDLAYIYHANWVPANRKCPKDGIDYFLLFYMLGTYHYCLRPLVSYLCLSHWLLRLLFTIHRKIYGSHIDRCTVHDQFDDAEQPDAFQGNASYAMYGMVTGAILNVILVPIFIFVLKNGYTWCSFSYGHRTDMQLLHTADNDFQRWKHTYQN